jgi:tetratricopeptide (TPR) repeat protein
MRLRPIAFVTLSWSAAVSVAAAPRPWVEVKTPHFTILSNDGESTARDVGWQFEQARTAYATLWRGATVKGGKPYVVFAARDEATLKALGPEYWERKRELDTVSFQVDGSDRQYVALRTDLGTGDDVWLSAYFTPYRAYVGSVLNSVVDRPLPPWLYRGMTEVYGNTRVRKEDILLGLPVRWHLQTVQRKGLLPLATVLAVERGSIETSDDQFNATAWGLVHYLGFGEKGTLAPRLNRFLNLWQQGRAPDVAVREALGDLGELEKGLRLYLARPTFPYQSFAVDAGVRRERFSTRILSAAEAAATQAALHVAMGRPGDARARIAEARTAEPNAPVVLDAEALLADREEDDAAALAAYGKAAAAGSQSFYTHYRLAQLTHAGAGDSRETFARIATSLDRAIQLNPDYAAAHAYLADVKSFLGDSQAALATARTAIVLDPGVSYHHVALARVLEDLGQPQEALASARRALALARDDRERLMAQQLLDRLRRPGAPRPAAGATAAGTTEPPPTSEEADAPRTRNYVCSPTETEGCSDVAAILEFSCNGGKGADCASLALLVEAGLVKKDAQRVRALRARARELLDPACRGGDAEACSALEALPK